MMRYRDSLLDECFDDKCEECKDEPGLVYDENGNLLCENCFFYKLSIGEYEYEEI